MKRLLATILALAMVISLAPAVFAEGETLGEDAGITITYEVSKNFGVWSKQIVQFAEFTYESNNGLWEYYGNANGLPTIDNSVTMNWDGTGGMQMRAGWWAIKIIVPKSGFYTPKIAYKEYAEAAMMHLYLIKKNGELKEADMNADNLIGSINCYDAQYTTKPTMQEPASLARRYIEAGEYYFVYYAGEKTSPRGTSWIFFQNVTLDGNGEDTLFSGISVADSVVCKEGETAKLAPTLYLNDGNVATGEYTVSYSSSDDDVAAVSADGTITAKNEGKAYITTSAVNEAGYTVSVQTDVEVFNGAVIKYDIVKHIDKDLGYYSGKTTGSLSALDETLTNGFYSYFGGNDYDGSKVKYYSNIQIMTVGTKVAFKINVPEAGYYDIIHDAVNVTSSNANAKRRNVDVGVYISKDAIDVTAAAKVGIFNSFSDDYKEGAKRQIKSARVKFDEPGSYIITFKLDKNIGGASSPYAGIYSFYLVGGTKSALMNGKITTTAASVNKDEGETATVSATGFNSETTAAETFTYSSSDTAIAAVDAETGVVTPKKAGKVTITATAKGADVANTLTTDITVTVNKPGEAVADMVSIYITGTEGGSVSADKVVVNEVTSTDAGETIKAEATANEGYKFAYWKDSAGNVVSESETYTFKAFTNTSIIAVFDNISEDAETFGVEFFDGNRDYLGFVAAEKGDLFESLENIPTPNLTGYEFTGWSIAENTVINAVLRAVALYEEIGNQVSGVKVNNNPVLDTKYDDEITRTVEGAKAWYRDEKLVGYGDTYTYYVWGNTEITSSTEDVAEKLPLAVLNTSGDAYMLEYDNAGYEIVDAGIIFGNDTHKEVNSCYYKAKVKNIKAHGQFTAKKSADKKYDQTVVRGYVMFKDTDGTLRVIYAD